jgi:hypothetical protein
LSLVIIRRIFWSGQFGAGSFLRLCLWLVVELVVEPAETLSRHGFVGSQNRLGFAGKVLGLVKSGFQNRLDFFSESLGNFCFSSLVKFSCNNFSL